jgi:hypothetical protein
MRHLFYGGDGIIYAVVAPRGLSRGSWRRSSVAARGAWGKSMTIRAAKS